MEKSIDIVSDADRLRPEKAVERLFADNSRLRSLTKWSPAYAGRDGFRRGITGNNRMVSQSGQSGELQG